MRKVLIELCSVGSSELLDHLVREFVGRGCAAGLMCWFCALRGELALELGSS